MDKELTELTEVLIREQEIYGRYFELLVEQQGYLVRNDIENVRETIERINALAQEAANCENERRRLLIRLSQMAQLDEEKTNLSGILDRLAGPRFQELEKLRIAFRNIQEKIEAQKRRNELLINHSMNMISHSPHPVHDNSNPNAAFDSPARIGSIAWIQASLISRMI